MLKTKSLCLISTLLIALSPNMASASDLIRGFYFEADFGAGAMFMKKNAANSLPKTFTGIAGHVELCQSNAITFDLCAGVSTFQTVGLAQKVETVGTITTTIDAEMSTFGGYVKARKRLLGLAIAPYVGLGQVKTNYTTTTLGFSTNSKSDSKVVFVGLELEKKILLSNFSLALKGEVGKSIGNSADTSFFAIKPSIKARF